LSTIEKNFQRTPADKNKALEAVLQSRQTRIRVVGCGGGGNNTIARLMEAGVKSIATLAINTDAQDLLATTADDKILIGQNMTKGLGAGSNPQIGEDSARESQPEIEEALLNTDLVFVTCGLGGGTGTGSAPIVAEIAKQAGALTISIVTLPFTEEGISRWENARGGLEKLRQNSDTVIVIQNDRLLEVVPDLPLGMAFKAADEILVNAVKGITELITEKGLVNLDFADVRTIMQNGGTAMIGIGESDAAESAQAAVEMAMQNKLLDLDITGAKNALINITGGAQMPLKDAKMVMKSVAQKLDPSAKIIWGARLDQNLGKTIRVMLIVTGLQEKRQVKGREEKRQAVEAVQPSIRAEEVLSVQIDLRQNAAAEKLFSEADTILYENKNGEYAESYSPIILHEEKIDQSDQIVSKRKRKAPSKSRQRSEALITDKQVLKLVETSEQAIVRDDIVRVTYADGLTPPENNFPAPVTSVGKTNDEMAQKNNTVSSANAITLSPAKSNDEASKPRLAAQADPVSQQINTSAAKRVLDFVAKNEMAQSAKINHPSGDRQNFDRKLQYDQTPIAKSPAVNGIKMAVAGNITDRPEPAAAKRGMPSSGKAGYHKIFAEQSRVHMQIIRESIGHLFTDPTRQENLQRLKHAAIAVNNLAKRFVFDVIAAYAAAIEEICARVLDGEINMNKKLVNAFTEIPAVFESMMNGEADAFVEAKRHQERLQRLADSFVDGEVVDMNRMDKRNAPANPAARPATTSFPRPAIKPSPTPATGTVSPPNRRPRPATEVMEYLDDLFAEGKKKPGA